MLSKKLVKYNLAKCNLMECPILVSASPPLKAIGILK